MIVLDASALIMMWVDRPEDDSAAAIRRHIQEHDNDVWTPPHFKLETALALRKQYLLKKISRDQVVTRLADLAHFEVSSLETEMLLPGVARYLDNATAYDAAYVALAELLDCPLITTDKRIAEIPGIRAKVLIV